MDITFSVLHAFHPASNPDGTADVRRVLHDCLVRLNRAPSTNGVGVAQYYVNGRLVVWNLPGAFCPDSTAEQDAYMLEQLLNCLIELNLSYLKFGGKRRIPKLYDSPVYYDRTQIWDTIPGLYKRGYGDCKSLTAALVAQYLHEGKECAPVFRSQKRPDGSGAMDFHILVQTADGFEDPSKVKGMGKNENAASIRGLVGKR